jgi:hypothetical protein
MGSFVPIRSTPCSQYRRRHLENKSAMVELDVRGTEGV